jgi:molecular chaperone GrpE
MCSGDGHVGRQVGISLQASVRRRFPDMNAEEQAVSVEQTKMEDKKETEELAHLRQSLEEQKAKVAEYLDQWRRAMADFANYRKRQERDQAQATLWANAGLLQSLLPVLDDLERALSELPTAEGAGAQEAAWAEGVRLVERKMRTTLEKSGLQEITSEKGLTFDPNLHEAVSNEESAELPEGTILQTARRGYRLGERVLRPAMVKVAKAPA